MNYYGIKSHLSNSDLNALRNASNAAEAMPGLQQVYDFGNLVDASVTEKHRISGNVLDIESGGLVSFEDHKIKQAQRMAEAYHADPALATIFKGARSQHAYFRNRFEIVHDGYAFELPVKCKLDLELPGIIGGDIKSTACNNYQAFKAAIELFNYDQQGAFYMDIARLDRFMIIGLSKKEVRGHHQVFKHLITRGDEWYTAGKAKYSALAFKHHIYFSTPFL